MLRKRGRLCADAAGAGRRAPAAKSRSPEATGASLVATANPGCHLQIARGLRDAGQAMDVAHPVSLLARAYSARVWEYANEKNSLSKRVGGPEQMKLVDAPKPAPGPKEAVVAIAFTGVNFLDVYFRTGLYKADTPIVLGSEASGTVESVGSEVTEVAPGDRVAYAMVRGSYAEYALVPAAATRQDSCRSRLCDGSSGHASGHDGALPDALDLSAQGRRHLPGARGRRRDRRAHRADGEAPRRARVRHGLDRREGAAGARRSAPTRRSSTRPRTSSPR